MTSTFNYQIILKTRAQENKDAMIVIMWHNIPWYDMT